MRFTLDTNCLIAIEKKEPDAPFVQELALLHGRYGINIAISAIGASERQRTGGYAKNFSEFQAKLKAIGFEGLELLQPRAYCDVTFFDHCVMADGNDTLEQEIHQLLFPNIEFLWADYAKACGHDIDSLGKKWRNAKCDVLALWCHIKHGGGVFVTGDKDDFHAETKQDKLKALGVGIIADPKDALALAKENLTCIQRFLAALNRFTIYRLLRKLFRTPTTT